MPIQRGRLRVTLLIQLERRNMIHYSKAVKSYKIGREGPMEAEGANQTYLRRWNTNCRRSSHSF